LTLGSLYYISLLDEELLTSAETPKRLLVYPGQVHVRDLALMLEEILYFFRPQGKLLSEQTMKEVLMRYDVWVAERQQSLDPTVLSAATALLHAQGADEVQSSEDGYFVQQRLVATLKLSDAAQELQSMLERALPHHHKLAPDGRQSAAWCDIRCVLDSARLKSDAGGGIQSSPRNPRSPRRSPRRSPISPKSPTSPKLSVAARTELKKLRMESVHIAHATVPFHIFARYIYVILKELVHEGDGEGVSPLG